MNQSGAELFPLFLKLRGRAVLLVGGGPVATAKAQALAQAGALVTVVAPQVTDALVALAAAQGWLVHQRGFVDGDVAGVWLVIAAATSEVNRAVAQAAEARQLFVVAVDDPPSASAYGAGIVRKAGVTLAISTAGRAPALAGLLREGLEDMLPDDLESWGAEAARQRAAWRADGTPMAQRRPRLLAALNRLYEMGTLKGFPNPPATTPLGEAELRQRDQLGTLGGIANPPATTPLGEAELRQRDELGTLGGFPDPAATTPLGEAERTEREEVRAAGRVALVGAGPGDPELLTRRGAQRLAEADIVFYDALSSEAMRALAPGARWFYVGKRACRQSIAQDTLNRLLIKEASRGRRVVRLKAGDPFVFGRGGEEALALAHAGIPCEVVPGVSSAVAAAALAGIPVTHRGVASAFTVVSGHHAAVYRPVLAGVPRTGATIVVLMGLRQRAAIAEHLLQLGWSAETPAAVVLGAATPAAARFVSTLGALATSAASGETGDEDFGRPGVLVIGEAVAVAGEIERAYATASAADEGARPQASPDDDRAERERNAGLTEKGSR